MIQFPFCGTRFPALKVIVVVALSCCYSDATLSASNISGIVRNVSLGRPSAGDDVALLRLDDGMQEAHSKTDASGAFVLPVQYPDKRYLVRVIHQNVGYDQRASAGEALSMQVFDAAQSVRGVSGSIEILRAGGNGNQLHVSDLYEIQNNSSPPLTQAGEHTFEVYLPIRAKIDSVLAAGPDKIGVLISATAVPGEPGHYVLDFPLRPGATKFAFNYDLPYDGHAAIETRHMYPLQQFAVMIPSSIQFSSKSPSFQVLVTGNSRYQVQAASHLLAGKGPAFGVSGEGELPPLGDPRQSLSRESSAAIRIPTVTAPQGTAVASLSNVDSGLRQTQPPSQTVVIEGLTAVLIAACVLLLWRARKPRRVSSARQ